jgi:hypothetical protein
MKEPGATDVVDRAGPVRGRRWAVRTRRWIDRVTEWKQLFHLALTLASHGPGAARALGAREGAGLARPPRSLGTGPTIAPGGMLAPCQRRGRLARHVRHREVTGARRGLHRVAPRPSEPRPKC